MDQYPIPSRRFHVLIAAAVVVCLAGLLVVRLTASTSAHGDDRSPLAAAATVPDPRPLVLADLEFPTWGSREARGWTVEFKTDLDLLAPLGTGRENAAQWFKDFTKEPAGPRLGEARAAMDARVDTSPRFGKVLPPDHPLLLEAEPWCDQATMRFYPDFFELDGWATVIPNLLVPLNLAKSWVARGLEAEDPESGLEDCRRAIRLGRLLRQEPVTVIADLVGMACIAYGVEGVYTIARDHGELELALLAAVTLSEYAPQRFLTAQRIEEVNIWHFMRADEDGKVTLDLPDAFLDAMLEPEYSIADSRFNGERIMMLTVVRLRGTPGQRARVDAFLREMAAGEDPLAAELATWALDADFTDAELVDILDIPTG